jgi:sec-independent protein translocase protein TatB
VGSIGFWELVFLVLIALLVFGPEKLPGMANSIGKAIGALRREASGTLDELRRAADLEDFRGVAGEIRDVRAELRRGLGGLGAAAPVSAAAAGEQAAVLTGPAPFDPDAT